MVKKAEATDNVAARNHAAGDCDRVIGCYVVIHVLKVREWRQLVEVNYLLALVALLETQ